MNPALLLAAALATLPTSTVERDGVRLETAVRAGLYTWTVTNASAPPITSVEIPQQRTYDAQAPEGWQVDHGRTSLRAWTEDPLQAITPGRSRHFSTRVGSAGGVLVWADVLVGFGDGSAPVELERVWAPRRPLRSTIALIAVTVAGLAIVHALVVARAERRSQERS